MKILYDDNYITVCIKPPALLSEKSDTGNDIISALENFYLANSYPAEIYPLHRLDRGVGGVMVFAKGRDAAAKMSALIANGALEKEYLAIVTGVPDKQSGIYEDLLFKDSRKNKSFVVDRKRAGVREAKLSYRVIETKSIDAKTFSLVKIKLYTGRSHQIRVQFSSRKMPLYGDRKYGSSNGRDIALFSYRLAFTHPITDEKIEIKSIPQGDIWESFNLTDV